MKNTRKFSESLVKLLSERNISINKLSQEVGIRQQSLNQLKLGRTLPSLETLLILADFFFFIIDELVGRSDVREVNIGG
jgi:transcriptional regulator with XRE-family HTH domain